MSAPPVVVRDLHKVYRARSRSPHVALRGVDLELHAGSAFGLIGVNGAGKTTLIKALLGIVSATQGSIRLLGAPPGDTRARRKVGYLPERLVIPPAWTGRAFVTSAARLKGVPDPGRAADALLERVGLTREEANTKAGRYSKGMRQRAGLAAALLGAPEVLVLDEPTDGIDPLGRSAMRRLLIEERARGASILLNSHLLSETERICDRIGILDAGALVVEGALDDLALDRDVWTLEVAQGADPQALGAAGFVAADEAWELSTPDPGEANAALDRVRAAGVVVTGFGRHRRDLEELLATRVKGREC